MQSHNKTPLEFAMPKNRTFYNFSARTDIFIECLKCNNLTLVGPCSNCGHEELQFVAAESEYGIMGNVLCHTCGHKFYYWICDNNNCNCNNPYERTLYK